MAIGTIFLSISVVFLFITHDNIRVSLCTGINAGTEGYPAN